MATPIKVTKVIGYTNGSLIYFDGGSEGFYVAPEHTWFVAIALTSLTTGKQVEANFGPVELQNLMPNFNLNAQQIINMVII